MSPGSSFRLGARGPQDRVVLEEDQQQVLLELPVLLVRQERRGIRGQPLLPWTYNSGLPTQVQLGQNPTV